MRIETPIRPIILPEIPVSCFLFVFRLCRRSLQCQNQITRDSLQTIKRVQRTILLSKEGTSLACKNSRSCSLTGLNSVSLSFSSLSFCFIHHFYPIDLQSVLMEVNGDVETAIIRISEGRRCSFTKVRPLLICMNRTRRTMGKCSPKEG